MQAPSEKAVNGSGSLLKYPIVASGRDSNANLLLEKSPDSEVFSTGL